MSPLRLLLPGLFLASALLRAEPSAAFGRPSLLEGLAANLAAHYSLTDSLDVDLIRPWTAPDLAAPGAPVTVVVMDYPEAVASSMLVRVRYQQDERILREDTLALRVNLWRDGMVAVSPLKRGDPISLQGVTTRRIDALRDREALPVSAAGEDYVFAREVPAGRSLSWRDVVRRSLVHRGQIVEVFASDGALVITMKALAMQDGARGDAVRVRNLESKREFTARVTGENRAEVRF
ncbi:MAG TPA: flagellar basal body P-ring formation chaperone FlgA [Rariglobus sp.]